MRFFSLLLLGATLLSPALAQLSVTALHPVIGDLTRSVGGEHVVVHDLLPLGGNPHTFEPTAADLARLSRTKLVFASGKKLEPYLDKLHRATPAPIVEVGRRIPSILVDVDQPLFLCCPEHAKGCIDPHWWHNPLHMKRAARTVAEALAKADPTNAAAYKANAAATGKRMDALHKWVKGQVATIPRSQRKLVTAHLAFGYFCKEYGFKAMGLQGLSQAVDPSPRDLAAAVKTIQKEKLVVAFPEHLANPELLQTLHRETGIRLGPPLLADTLSDQAKGYEDMIRANVNAIVRGFKAR